MKFFLKNQGVITAFVTLIMVPVVVFTGIFVDMSRFKFCSSQAIMAADSYSEGVLSIYNNILKELYGLYAISTHEKGKVLIDAMDDYAKYSFNPAADKDFGVAGHMPYASTDVEVSHTNVEGATLSNSNVLLTQVADFMQYRIVGEMVKDSGILDALDKIQKTDDDSAAVEIFSDMGESSADALAGIQRYYEYLEEIDAYLEYKDIMEKKFREYSKFLTDISCSTEYAGYINYKNNKGQIDEAKEYVDDYENRKETALANGEEFTEELDTVKAGLAEQWVDEAAYLAQLTSDLNAVQSYAKNTTYNPIHFGNAGKIIDGLRKEAEGLQTKLIEIVNLKTKLEAQLETCSEDLKRGIQEDIAQLDKITDMAHEFMNTYHKIETINHDTTQNSENQKKYEEALVPLDEIKDQLMKTELAPGTTGWETEIELDWYNFREDQGALKFYFELKQLCKEVEGVEGDKKAGEKKIEEAEGKLEEAKKEIEEGDKDDKPERSIGSLAGQLKIASRGEDTGENNTEGTKTDIGILGTFNIGQGVTNVIDKFLLASYDFGMFSSRVTGIEEKEGSEDNRASGDSKEEYADYSLTKVEMSPAVNYLYKAELEYLFGGKADSKDNWDITRNTICSVRMAFNFVSTYAIDAIDTPINMAANAAQAAVTAGTLGLGAGAGVLVKIAVSAALRGAVAGCETAAEWKQLKNRESVLLYKTHIDDMEIAEQLSSIIGDSTSGNPGKKSSDIRLSYEDYLYLLMILFINTETLTDRTADLITLNVNYTQGEEALSKMAFKMSEAVTAIESTCKVKMDFIIVPDNFANMFIGGTESEAKIKSLEDRYTGFTLIRGY